MHVFHHYLLLLGGFFDVFFVVLVAVVKSRESDYLDIYRLCVGFVLREHTLSCLFRVVTKFGSVQGAPLFSRIALFAIFRIAVDIRRVYKHRVSVLLFGLKVVLLVPGNPPDAVPSALGARAVH